jgi:hypothetical protein
MAPISRARSISFGLFPRAAGWSLAVILTCFLNTAWAQTASEKAAAEALFDQGVQELKQGQYASACRKLERSQAVEPGIGTLLYLGECYKKLGRTASAWATFREAASKARAAGEVDRAEAGASRADALEPELSFVSFEVAEETASLPGLKIVQGSNLVSSALFGTKVPVDPGELKVVASAPDHQPFEMTITIQKGPSETLISVPVLPLLPEGERQKQAKEDRRQADQVSADPTHDSGPKAGSTQRTIGVVLGALGVASLGAGTVFGILAINKDKKADDVCDENTCDPGSDGYDLSSTATTFGHVSTATIAAGAALVVGGAVVYFTAPKQKNTAVLLQPTLGGARLSLSGSF